LLFRNFPSHISEEALARRALEAIFMVSLGIILDAFPHDRFHANVALFADLLYVTLWAHEVPTMLVETFPHKTLVASCTDEAIDVPHVVFMLQVFLVCKYAFLAFGALGDGPHAVHTHDVLFGRVILAIH
jgi:hypothetical protein